MFDISNTIREIELDDEDFLENYDWAQVFADENWGNVSKDLEAVPPGIPVSTEHVWREDVEEIIAAVNGENDGLDWLGLFLLKDGRYLVAVGGCDYTGWDCRAGNNLFVSDTLDNIIQFGLSKEERNRLGIVEVGE